MRGILMAGGSGSRLAPVTTLYSKHLIPVYDKPMVYYSLSALMLAGAREILIVLSPSERAMYEHLLGDGRHLGIDLKYAEQPRPEGIAQGLILAGEFLENERSCMILGDNFFHGAALGTSLSRHAHGDKAVVLACEVADPRPYAVVEFDAQQSPCSITEKPVSPASHTVVTGMYFYPAGVAEVAQTLKPSQRGELEITDLNNWYLERKLLYVDRLPRGTAWLDLGTWDSLSDASMYVRIVEQRQGLKVGCPEEIAWRQKWISNVDLQALAERLGAGEYARYLSRLVSEGAPPP